MNRKQEILELKKRVRSLEYAIKLYAFTSVDTVVPEKFVPTVTEVVEALLKKLGFSVLLPTTKPTFSLDRKNE